VTVDKLNFGFTIKSMDVTYAGTLNSDRTAIQDTATPRGETHVLNRDRHRDSRQHHRHGYSDLAVQ
jgi:hypothetical protein